MTALTTGASRPITNQLAANGNQVLATSPRRKGAAGSFGRGVPVPGRGSVLTGQRRAKTQAALPSVMQESCCTSSPSRAARRTWS